jgi:hypothetical protein
VHKSLKISEGQIMKTILKHQPSLELHYFQGDLRCSTVTTHIKYLQKQLPPIEATIRANHQQRGKCTLSSLKCMYCKTFSHCRVYHPLHSFSFKRTTMSPLPSTSSRQPEQPWRNQAPQKSIFKYYSSIFYARISLRR